MNKIDIHIHARPEYGPTMDGYVRLMDEHDVAVALVHATHTLPEGTSAPGNAALSPVLVVQDRCLPLQANDDAVLAACEAHPGRLYGSVCVDLRDPPAHNITKIERYAAAGFRCVKMFPNLGFDPNDEIHEPVWQAIESLGLACLSHCGWLLHRESTRGTRLSCLTASPLHFEVPARRHPGINFIFAHFGGGATYLETITLCERLDNCFADCCRGWGVWVWAHRMPGVEDFPMDKFLYGTDNIGASYSEDEVWWTELLTDMGRTPEELAQFFRGNAARLLGL